MSRATVVIVLEEDAPFSRDLAAGGVFVPGCTLALAEECELVVCGASDQLRLAARVVYVDEQRGAGLELLGFTPELKAQLAALEPLVREPQGEEAMEEDDELAIPIATDEDAAEPTTRDAALDEAAEREAPLSDAELATAFDALEDDTADEPHARNARRAPRNVHERLRGLTLSEQLKLASQGELHERIVIERLYGKTVWETLLRNPRLTAPEAARIARYGSLPRVLLEIIVGNATWLQIPEVRRALLSNPRLATDQIVKILRLVPKHELKLAAIQTAYPFAVRNAAKLLLRGQGD